MQVGEITEKFCKKCTTTKPVSAFSIVRRVYKSKSGERIYMVYQTDCRPCMVERSRQADRTGYIRPSKKNKVLNDQKEVSQMQRAPSWGMQKIGYEPSKHKEYPTCEEGHKYVGTRCLLCKYGILKQLTVR